MARLGRRLLTLRNDFHGSSVRVLSGRKSPATARRIRRGLCALSGCCCGGTLGQRGSQLQPNGLREAMVEAAEDGGAVVAWVNLDGNKVGGRR